jgi:molybdopterin converting factor small subunit
MQVIVELWAHLIKYAPDGQKSFSVSCNPGTDVAGLLSELGIPKTIPKVVLINGLRASPDTRLTDEDEIIIFPPTAGG